MEKNITSWTTADGLTIYGKHWPAVRPKAVLCIVHGIGEHIHRYEEPAAFYNRAGVSIIGNDHRGHGRSEGKRGHTPSMDLLLDEVEQLIARSQTLYPDLPCFLFGQSMGGNLVLNYSLRRRPAVAGVIASSPWIQLAFRPDPISVLAGKLLKNIYPTFTQPTKLNPEHLSTDPEVGKAYQEDPLVHNRITAALGTEMLEAADYLHQYRGKFPVPLLLMHGTADQIVAPEASRQFADRVEGEITFIPWEGLYHELHNEVRRKDVLNSTLSWMETHLTHQK